MQQSLSSLPKALQTNAMGQPVGYPVSVQLPRPFPPLTPLQGHHCRIVPLNVEAHAEGLFQAMREDHSQRNWTYLPYGPFTSLTDYKAWLRRDCTGKDPLFHTVLNHAGQPVGIASYLRIHPESGCVEVGHIHFSPRLQRTTAATEAMYLMMRRVFDELGYRRYEWKCDALNAASRRAAERLGFIFEGIFRQATVYKGRNRDTAWFSIIDHDWPHIRMSFDMWLHPDNFDERGRQRNPLQITDRSKSR